VLEETEVITDASDDGVGNLSIVRCSVVKKIAADDRTHCILNDEGGIVGSKVTKKVQTVKSELTRDVDDERIPPTTSSAIRSQIP
jgi:hypothetical protein